MKTRLSCGAFFVLIAAVHADEQVRSTQEELRRRNVFFGDIDGRRSTEYGEAVRRYQSRKGLPANGREDRDTLRSLGLLARSPNEAPPKELAWPEEPVLKSDAAPDFTAAARELSRETGVSAERLAPVAASQSARTKRPRPATRPGPASTPQRAPRASDAAPKFSLRNPNALSQEVTKFVSEYLRAVGRNKLQEELHFYADRVDYFGQGDVDRRLIERSLRQYYERWPKRNLTLLQPVRYQSYPGRAEIVVTYRTGLALSGEAGKVRGLTENRLTLNAATADPRIVAIEERRVRP